MAFVKSPASSGKFVDLVKGDITVVEEDREHSGGNTNMRPGNPLDLSARVGYVKDPKEDSCC